MTTVLAPTETAAPTTPEFYAEYGRLCGEALAAERLASGQSAPDVNIVLGRGLDGERLNDTGYDRVALAMIESCLAIRQRPDAEHAVIFSGGHSWPQEADARAEERRTGIRPAIPDEGTAMLRMAQLMLSGCDIPQLKLMSEVRSTSTAENFAFSQVLVPEAKRVAIVTDDQHIRYDRPQDLAQLAFPEAEIQVNTVVELPDRSWKVAATEFAAAAMSQLFMRKVRPGDTASMVRQQAKLQRFNSGARAFVKSLLRVPRRNVLRQNSTGDL